MTRLPMVERPFRAVGAPLLSVEAGMWGPLGPPCHVTLLRHSTCTQRPAGLHGRATDPRHHYLRNTKPGVPSMLGVTTMKLLKAVAVAPVGVVDRPTTARVPIWLRGKMSTFGFTKVPSALD